MRQRLDRAAGLLLPGSDCLTFPWGEVRYEHVAYLRSRLLFDGASPSTLNMVLCGVRQVARCARRRHQMSADELADLLDVEGVRLERLPRGRMLSEEECDRLVGVCAADRTARGRRDACLLALALGAGLRREEIARLPVKAFDPEASAVRLIGKGGREARLPLTEGYARAVAEWLRVRGRRAGPMLSPFDLEGRVQAGEEISHQAVYRAVLRRARAAGIERCTPHDLRRTYISNLLDATDGETARELARHASFDTTGRYSRRGERAKREAVERLHDPFITPITRRTRRKLGRRRKARRARPVNLMRKNKTELLSLAAAHEAEFDAEMSKEELVAAINEAVRRNGQAGD
jgi:site-specific recombinase XerC